MRVFRSKRIQGVIFDIDDTLIKSRAGGRRGAQKALRTAARNIAKHLRKRGYVYGQAQLLRRLRRIDDRMLHRKSYDRDLWWKILLKELGLSKLQGPWLHETTLLSWDAYAKGSPPFRDVEATLRKLKEAGLRLAVVSDSDGTPGIKKWRIQRLPFRKFFETIVVAGEDTPKVKPSKAPFLLVAKRLRIPPVNCVYVGDNPRTDISGAKAAGMTTILIRRGGPRKGRPTYTVKSLREILRILLPNRPR